MRNNELHYDQKSKIKLTEVRGVINLKNFILM